MHRDHSYRGEPCERELFQLYQETFFAIFITWLGERRCKILRVSSNGIVTIYVERFILLFAQRDKLRAIERDGFILLKEAQACLIAWEFTVYFTTYP